MKIAMLARNANLYSHKRLVEAAESREHDIKIIDTLRVYINLASHRPDVRYRGEKLPKYDAVIPRIGASITHFGTAVLRQFEVMGMYPLNESVAIARARDKLRSLQLLARRGIGLPVTAFAHSTSQADDLIDMVGGPPLVIKLLESTHGAGVVLADTRSSARSIIQAFSRLKADFIVQEFIKEAGGEDLRCFVIGNRVVASMKRRGAAGDFRSNLHQGGNAEKVKITPEERMTAVRAAKTMGLSVAGVDLLRSNHGPVVMEVNSTPGLEGIETATGKDIAGSIIQFIEKNAKPNRTRTRGKG